MELDDLKAAWEREATKNLELNKQNMEQLKLILKEKTAGTLTGMKRKYGRIITFLLVGIFANILVHPFLHFLLGDDGPVFRLTYGGLLSLLSIVIVCLIVVSFYWMKYSVMKITVPDTDLKLALAEKIRHLNRSFRQEIFFIVSVFVVVFIMGRATSQYLGNGDFLDIFRTDILLAMLAGFSIMGFYIYKRVRFYRANISELKQYLAAFNEEPRKARPGTR
ncbi:hypothetical protein EDD80_102284 [Anseongella ginsenosidimutans]|uniref:Uncharacterized protein n=1 Tax=Anseongella ginsenosidimutans TaxID=496056 RepID=A0A4R3KVH1_9SPHI|nr:hypothetical protein [Anseongella ginsenosidimutans]QEC51728.1 hypothetical protein FRZ59_04835 [Anseongella ginsenosidimutans]TCS89091.1 hypothetical protein EDD80_102284 [Anseongella ginsenosidimutans]